MHHIKLKFNCKKERDLINSDCFISYTIKGIGTDWLLGCRCEIGLVT